MKPPTTVAPILHARIPFEKLVFLDDNPRTRTPEGLQQMAGDIQADPTFFDNRPVLVNLSEGIYQVYAGDLRAHAAHDVLGWPDIPCNIERDVPLPVMRRRAIQDNTHREGWDAHILHDRWGDVDLEAAGLAPDDWGIVEDAPTPTATDDGYTPPADIHTDIVPGDLITIGPHRLLCGDSTSADDVAKVMGKEKADLGFNDPPYGMKKESEGVTNDNLNFDDLLRFNQAWIPLQFSYLKENGSFYVWGTDEPLMDIYSNIIKPYIKTQKATFRNIITWNKGHGQGQNSENIRMYAIADEKCLFVMCGVQGFNNNADNYFEGWEPIRKYLYDERMKCGWDVPTMKTIAGHSDKNRDHWTHESQWSLVPEYVYQKFQKWAIDNEVEAFKREYDSLKREYDSLKREYYATRAYFNNTHDNFNNVWNFPRDIDNSDHATPKPVKLCARAIESSCPDGGVAVDFFLGSGTTMVAAHQLHRRCYGLEIDPKYCQVIIDRMHKLDPALPITINGKKYENPTAISAKQIGAGT